MQAYQNQIWTTVTHGALAAAVGLVLAGFCAAPASARERLFTPPPGCTAFLTVQSRSCMVSHYWTCDDDPKGTSWRISLDQDGPLYLSHTDREFRWLRNFDLRDGASSTLVIPEDDPASLTELFETGIDSMAFTMNRESSAGTEQQDYIGFDLLTGETVTIDGRTLLVTSFSYEYDTGSGPQRVNGSQTVSEDWHLFFGGIETVTTPDGITFESDSSPMQFAEPGEDGFLTRIPLYDCGDTISALPFTSGDQG
ncbi:MAG: hypothetical protein GDA52_09430 [Rhodobacteraceae bacterium]|nr:hypothetical protein [Paracoccaceae bacterium]